MKCTYFLPLPCTLAFDTYPCLYCGQNTYTQVLKNPTGAKNVSSSFELLLIFRLYVDRTQTPCMNLQIPITQNSSRRHDESAMSLSGLDSSNSSPDLYPYLEESARNDNYSEFITQALKLKLYNQDFLVQQLLFYYLFEGISE